MAQIDEIVGKQNIDQIVQLDASLIKLDETFMKVYKSAQQAGTVLNQSTQSWSNLKKAQEETATSAKKLTEAEKDALELQKQRTRESKKYYEGLAKQEAEEKKMIATMQMEAKTVEQLQAQVKAFEQAKKKLNITTEEGRKKTAEYNAVINKNTEIIRQNASAAEKQRMNIGNYASAIKGLGRQLLSAIGLTSGIMLLVGAIRNMFNITKEFEKGQSNLAAVLGKTRKETENIAKSAVELGRVTVYSAREVTGLQTELAKLGFTENQILSTSKAVLDFAAATNAALPDAAKVTGVALRAYGLSMSDAEDVTATLAVATTKSALAFADYETVLSTVGPIAKTFGFSLEDTVALMGTLKNAGFDASTGATALRNILLNLADSNGLLAKELGKPVKTLPDLIGGLKELKDKGVDLNTTLQLTDKRSVAAFNTFLSGTDTIAELKDGITGVTKELQGMVETQLDNVAGDIKLLSSSWEGFVLSMQKGDGPVNKFIRGTLQAITNLFSQMAGAFQSVDSIIQKAKEKSLAGAFTGDIEEVNNIANSLIKNGVPAVDAYTRARELLRMQFIREKAEVWDNAEAVADWEARIEHLNNYQFGANDKLIDDNKTIILTEEELKKLADEKQKRLEAEIKLRHEIYLANSKTQEEEYKEYVEAQEKKADALAGFKTMLDEYRDESESLDFVRHQAEIKRNKELKDAELARIEEVRQAEIEAYQRKLQSASDIGEQLAAIGQAYLDIEFGNLEKSKQHELALAGDSAEKRAEVEEKYAKKSAELKRKQAKADKALNIFRAIIGTATAIINALNTQPFLPLGPIMAALAGVLGGVQVAAIASQPIPQFFKGTDSAPDGVISLSEKGREIIKTKSGQVLMVNEPTLAAGLKGAKIYSNPETERMIAAGAFGYDSKELQRTLERNNDRLIRTIQNKKEIHISASKREITERSGGNWTTYKNSYFR